MSVCGKKKIVVVQASVEGKNERDRSMDHRSNIAEAKRKGESTNFDVNISPVERFCPQP